MNIRLLFLLSYIFMSFLTGCGDSEHEKLLAEGKLQIQQDSADGLIVFSDDGKTLEMFCDSTKKHYKVPYGIEVIAPNAFDAEKNNINSLSKIELPDTVKIIGAEAFKGNEKLIFIKLPDSVTEIGERAFFECSSLRTVKLPAGLSDISEGLFVKCINLTSVKIPENVCRIGRTAFFGCPKLSKIVLPDNLKIIEEGAFAITGLKQIKLPSALTKISKLAFFKTNLSEVVCNTDILYETILQEKIKIHPDAFLLTKFGCTMKPLDEDENVVMKMVGVKPGAVKDNNGRTVAVSAPFYVGIHEVTNAQWGAVMGTAYEEKDADKPAEKSWHEALNFCDELNKTQRAPDGWKFALPSEEQWIYVAKGGIKSCGFKYSGSNSLDKVGWTDTWETKPVGQKAANELGVFDMHGNVWELCFDKTMIGGSCRNDRTNDYWTPYAISTLNGPVGFRIVLEKE